MFYLLGFMQQQRGYILKSSEIISEKSRLIYHEIIKQEGRFIVSKDMTILNAVKVLDIPKYWVRNFHVTKYQLIYSEINF